MLTTSSSALSLSKTLSNLLARAHSLHKGRKSCNHLLLSGLSLSLLLGNASILAGLGSGGLSTVVLADGLDNGLLLLGLVDGDGVRERLLGTGLALGVRAAHDLDLDTQDTLAEQDVAGGVVDELLSGLTGVDHEAVGELHGLGTGGTELAGDDNLATLGAGLHDEAEDTIAGTADSQAVEKLVAEGLALGDGGQTAVLDLGGVQGDGVLGELESLLDEGGELADAATLLSEDLLGLGGTDDDIGDGRGDADLDARVTLLSELALEELVQLGVEDTVSDELSPLGAVDESQISINTQNGDVCQSVNVALLSCLIAVLNRIFVQQSIFPKLCFQNIDNFCM